MLRDILLGDILSRDNLPWYQLKHQNEKLLVTSWERNGRNVRGRVGVAHGCQIFLDTIYQNGGKSTKSTTKLPH
jgi:hypothetical protein